MKNEKIELMMFIIYIYMMIEQLDLSEQKEKNFKFEY